MSGRPSFSLTPTEVAAPGGSRSSGAGAEGADFVDAGFAGTAAGWDGFVGGAAVFARATAGAFPPGGNRSSGDVGGADFVGGFSGADFGGTGLLGGFAAAGTSIPGGRKSSGNAPDGFAGGIASFLVGGAAFAGGASFLGGTDAVGGAVGVDREEGFSATVAGFTGGAADLAGGAAGFVGGAGDVAGGAATFAGGFSVTGGTVVGFRGGAAVVRAGGFDGAMPTGLPHFGQAIVPASVGFAEKVARQCGHATEEDMRRRRGKGSGTRISREAAAIGHAVARRYVTKESRFPSTRRRHALGVGRRVGYVTTAPLESDLPPRQRLVAEGKWPVVGERAAAPSYEPWRLLLAVEGEVVADFSLDDLRALPVDTRVIDLHCVTRWSRLGMSVTGVSLEALLSRISVPSDAAFVSWVARSERNHSSSLPLAEASRLGAMLVWEADGRPLSPEHGGPLRSVVPGKYFYKSVKWVERIDLLARDRLGYWEAEAGYHNGADPWREERYVAGGLSRQALCDLLATRDWSGREVLGLAAPGLDLAGLVARGAILRNANFAGAWLAGGDFTRANFSNASFVGADLAGADLRDADVEGAEFAGADLSGVDFRGASIFGATFRPLGPNDATIVDRSTRFGRRQLDSLTDDERRFLEIALQRAGAAVDGSDQEPPSP